MESQSMEAHISTLVKEQNDEAVNNMAGIFETQDLSSIETQLSELVKADRNIQRALLQ